MTSLITGTGAEEGGAGVPKNLLNKLLSMFQVSALMRTFRHLNYWFPVFGIGAPRC